MKVLDAEEYRKAFAFAFMDSPFNIGQEYPGYNDNKTSLEFRAHVRLWAEACWESLTSNGILALHGNDYLCEQYQRIAYELGWDRIGWIIWHYRFGQYQVGRWINSHAHCLIYARNPWDYTWNPDAVMVESDRASTYDDPRTRNSATPGKRVPLTIWGIPSDGPYWGRVQGNSDERCGNRPNQLPEVYLARLIRAYTNEGDRVLDPMGGTGTCSVVAQALKREFLTIDIDPDAIRTIKARLKKGAVRL